MNHRPRTGRLLALSILALAGCSADTEEGGGASDERMLATAAPPSFSGSTGGCRSVFTYRLSADRKQALTVFLDQRRLDLPVPSTRTFSIGTRGITVAVDVYARAVTDAPYCTDVDTGVVPTQTWTARRGSLEVILSGRPPTEPWDMFRATVRLTNVTFGRPGSSETITVPSAVMENVSVGWLPG